MEDFVARLRPVRLELINWRAPEREAHKRPPVRIQCADRDVKTTRVGSALVDPCHFTPTDFREFVTVEHAHILAGGRARRAGGVWCAGAELKSDPMLDQRPAKRSLERRKALAEQELVRSARLVPDVERRVSVRGRTRATLGDQEGLEREPAE